MNTHKTSLLLSSLFISALVVGAHAEGTHEHNHGNHSDHHWASPKDAAARSNPVKSDKKSIERGAKTYTAMCVACHGVTAEGDGVLAANLNPKPTNLKYMSGKHTDGDFAWKIANGKGAMPAWKDSLSENDIWDVVNFIQNLKGEDNKENKKDEHDHSTHTH